MARTRVNGRAVPPRERMANRALSPAMFSTRFWARARLWLIGCANVWPKMLFCRMQKAS